MDRNQAKGSDSKEQNKTEDVAEENKAVEEKNKGKTRKHDGKDDTVLGDINRETGKESE